MKTYEIRVTQDLSGYYQGKIEIEASSKKAALNKVKTMSRNEIDDKVDWEHGDEYYGDTSSIAIDESSIEEV